MPLAKIDDFRKAPEMQLDYQKISFALQSIGLNVDQDVFSDNTRQILLSFVSESTDGAYSLINSGDKMKQLISSMEADIKPKEITMNSKERRGEILARMEKALSAFS